MTSQRTVDTQCRRPQLPCPVMLRSAVLLLVAMLAVSALQAQHPDLELAYRPAEDSGIAAEVYRARRARLMAAMADSSVALFFSAARRVRQNDVYYEYRQNSNLLYLTGATESDCVLMLAPDGIRLDSGDTNLYREVLFVQRRDSRREIWNGMRMGAVNARRMLGIAMTVDIDTYPLVLEETLRRSARLYVADWPTLFLENPVFQTRIYSENKTRSLLAKRFPHVKLHSLVEQMAVMREVKDDEEIGLLRQAVMITIEGFEETIRSARPGMHEYELEAVMEFNFHRLGARSPGYPSIVGSGPNSCILHYIDNRRQTRPGDLVLMDCGAEFHGYTADISRTIPVNGVFSEEQRAIYRLVLEAQDSVLVHCRPGTQWSDIHASARRVIGSGLRELGILQDEADVSWYFMHGTSHMLGLDVHDVRSSDLLKAGMVFTVEPGIYINEGSPCDPRWWNIAVRIEDNILITDDGYEMLSAALPRRPEAIEALMTNAGQGRD